MNLEKNEFETVDIHLWEENPNHGPFTKGKYKKSYKRWGHTCCVFGGYMFVFSGEVDSDQEDISEGIFKICLEDIMNNMWSNVEFSVNGFEIKCRDSFSSVVIDQKWVMLFGHSQLVSLNDIIVYNFANQSFSKFICKRTLISRESHATALIHNRFIISYGGITIVKKKADYVDTSHKLCIIDYEDGIGVDIPDAAIDFSKHFKQRKSHTIISVQNVLMVFGGSTMTSVNKVVPDDLMDDMFLIKPYFFRKNNKNVKITDPFFSQISDSLFVRFSFEKVDYSGPKIKLHSHNVNQINHDLIIFNSGETVILDGSKLRVVCNTHVYCYSISRNWMFDIVTLADKMPKRISSTSISYLNAVFVYGGFNSQKRSLSNISIITFNFASQNPGMKCYSVDGKSAYETDDYELCVKKILYNINRKSEINNPVYTKRLFEKNEVL